MPSSEKPPISFLEYERLFRTINAIIATEDGDSSKACVFFAMAGAYLLDRNHGYSSARAMAGFAAYNLRLPTNLVLLMGSIEGNKPVSHEDAFHCWIEVDGYVIDLSAPLFDQMAPAERKGRSVKPKLFQKPIDSGVREIEGLNTDGAYMHVRNPALMIALTERFMRLPANVDLVEICAQWYTKPPKKMAPYVGVGNQHGQVKQVALSPIRLEGTW